jgi:hypothetical protein
MDVSIEEIKNVLKILKPNKSPVDNSLGTNQRQIIYAC